MNFVQESNNIDALLDYKSSVNLKSLRDTLKQSLVDIKAQITNDFEFGDHILERLALGILSLPYPAFPTPFDPSDALEKAINEQRTQYYSVRRQQHMQTTEPVSGMLNTTIPSACLNSKYSKRNQRG